MSTIETFQASDGYRLRYLSGRWAGEWQLNQEPVHTGVKVLESRRGSTSHQTNPWFALDRDGDSDLEHGSVWFGALAWSGRLVGAISFSSRLSACAIPVALACTAVRDSRTSFGLPVDPDVASSTARSGWGAAFPSREPLNPTVEPATRRQKGQMDGVMRSSIRARACRPRRSSTPARSMAATG